jgi:hypothetical protein
LIALQIKKGINRHILTGPDSAFKDLSIPDRRKRGGAACGCNYHDLFIFFTAEEDIAASHRCIAGAG